MENACPKFETFPKPCSLLFNIIILNDVVIPANMFSGHVKTYIIVGFGKIIV